MNQEKINFRQARDFGETFNVSVKFLRQNFKLFFQSIIFIAGPLILISAIAGAFYQSNAVNLFSFKQLNQTDPFAQFGPTYFAFIIASIFGHLTLLGTTYSFLIVYYEKGPGNFSVNDVASTLFKNMGKIIGGFFLFFFLVIIVCVVIGLIIALLAFANAALGIFFGIMILIGLLIVMPPFMWQFSTFYLIAMQDNIGVVSSMTRTRDVMRGEFWWTWVIVVCATLAIGIIGLVFTMPQAAFQLVLMFSHLKNESGEPSVLFLIVATICTFCTTVLYSCLYVIYGFHYYSLAEKKDGIGLMERINEIGTIPKNNVEQQY